MHAWPVVREYISYFKHLVARALPCATRWRSAAILAAAGLCGMAAQRQLYGRAACALLVCVLAAALTAAQDDEEGEVRLDPRTCYHFYNGSACARPGVFEPSAGGNATYDPLGGEGFAGVYATPLSFDRHTGEWEGATGCAGSVAGDAAGGRGEP